MTKRNSTLKPKKSLEQDLTETLNTLGSLRLRAKLPDNLEDYFHDALLLMLEKGRHVQQWMGYIYKSISRMLWFGREPLQHLSLDEQLIPYVEAVSLDIKIDIRRALATLSPKRRAFILDYFYSGYTLDEIAEAYGISHQRVARIIADGLYDMKLILEGYNEGSKEN